MSKPKKINAINMINQTGIAAASVIIGDFFNDQAIPKKNHVAVINPRIEQIIDIIYLFFIIFKHPISCLQKSSIIKLFPY